VFQVLFSIPERPNKLYQPRTLRSYLAAAKDERRTKYPLNERFALAKRLARSIMFVHTSNLVHKNIRPDTIVLFQDGKSLMGIPFLVGFQKIRPANGATWMVSDAEWEKDLYRHPTRQGLKPEDTYKMQHDIYSLGVLLLEIGLWTSFVQWNGKDKYFEPGPDLKVDAETLAIKDVKRKANIIKDLLLRMAMELLPGAMGPKYAEVVISCLTCLDKGNDKFESEEGLVDEDGIVVGVRYVEIVSTCSFSSAVIEYMRAITDGMGVGGVLGCDETGGDRGLKFIHGVFFGLFIRASCQHKGLGRFANLAFSSEHILKLSPFS
jgi:hypothetical protein